MSDIYDRCPNKEMGAALRKAAHDAKAMSTKKLLIASKQLKRDCDVGEMSPEGTMPVTMSPSFRRMEPELQASIIARQCAFDMELWKREMLALTRSMPWPPVGLEKYI